MADIPALAMLFGLLGTTSLHLAKAFTRQGIDTFRLKQQVDGRKKKSAIWIAGFILNNIVTVFGILGQMFGPPTVYNSVFGIGLIILLIYAHYILNETISKRELLGAALIIVGTLGIGMVSIFYAEDPTVIYSNFFSSFYFLVPLISVMIFVGYFFRKFTLILFASTGGILGAIGNAFIYIGNLDGSFTEINGGTWPDSSVLIPLYIVGLLLGALGFLLSQIAFYRGADASKYVPIFNGLFFITPFIYELFIFQITPVSLSGFLVKLPFLITVLFGIYFIIGILIKTLRKPATNEIQVPLDK